MIARSVEKTLINNSITVKLLANKVENFEQRRR